MVHFKYHSLLLLVVCLLIPAFVRLGLLGWIQAAENSFPNHQVSISPTKVQPKLLLALPGFTRLVADRRYSPNYGKLPLSFEANRGQTDGRVRFLAHGRGYTLFLTGNEAVLALRKDVAPTFRSARGGLKPGATTTLDADLPDILPSSIPWEKLAEDAETPPDRRPSPTLPSPSRRAGSGEDSSVLRMCLIGANASAPVTGVDELPGKSNYFIGNDPKKWRTNVPNYSKVKYRNVYPGVDLVYYGNPRQLEYDFVVAPGADPSVIALDVAAGLSRHPSSKSGGVKPPLQIAPDGGLMVKTDDDEVRFHKPLVYQAQWPVASGKWSAAEDNRQSPITNRISIEAHYLSTASNQVRFALGPYDHTRPLVIDPVLVYSTYLGGGIDDEGNAIAVDSAGLVYVTGGSESVDFPTETPYQASNHASPHNNVFVAKLNAAGSALIYSTYLGGSDALGYIGDIGNGIAVDSSGNAYVTGYTSSTNFPTVNPLQSTNHAYPNSNVFVAKLNPAGSALVYSTYLGGSGLSLRTVSILVTLATASPSIPPATPT